MGSKDALHHNSSPGAQLLSLEFSPGKSQKKVWIGDEGSKVLTEMLDTIARSLDCRWDKEITKGALTHNSMHSPQLVVEFQPNRYWVTRVPWPWHQWLPLHPLRIHAPLATGIWVYAYSSTVCPHAYPWYRWCVPNECGAQLLALSDFRKSEKIF